MNEANNTEVQMRKGILDYCILLLISKGEVYASDLIDELKNAKMIVVEGTLYPLLNRLQKGELLSYNWQESNSGPPRKYYLLTEKGRELILNLNDTWNNMRTSVDFIIQQIQKIEVK